ncbi:energy transducer TonB [Xenorhabdus littoralis]|uniref:energy transducer TonB n=1 Tax=Xenorhabdus littoralis TaxID=2582835 RepID=UPI0029E82990|nr:energy transducer TonB [Xenorhabdus sp. psl]MDX7992177.1 energy transducer TonB [Xenorhabdus sp. psl]
MTNTAILGNPVTHSPLTPPKGVLVSILIAILLHISLIWLFNRHTSHDADTVQYINNSTDTSGLSITMVAASSWENEPEPVSPPPALLTAPESPTKPEIVLDKAVHPENKLEKPLEPNKPKKRKKQQKEKTTPSPQVQKDNPTEQETNGSDQVNSQGSMSQVKTSQPLVGQGSSEMNNYNARLRQEIERHKVYPRKAKRMKQQGTVTVNFTLLNDGTLAAARVVNSSGSSTLDNAALDAINSASAVGTKPAGMAPEVTLALNFTLHKAH